MSSRVEAQLAQVGIGPDYDRMLMAWHANSEASWPLFANRSGERFHRMWRYYLLSRA